MFKICPSSTPDFPNILGIPMSCATNIPVDNPYMFVPPLAFFVLDWCTLLFMVFFTVFYRTLGGEGVKRQMVMVWLFWMANVAYDPYGFSFPSQFFGTVLCFWIGSKADVARSGSYGSIFHRFNDLGEKVKGL